MKRAYHVRDVLVFFCLFVAVAFLWGCNAQLVDNPDGSGKIASSFLALQEAETHAVDCLLKAEAVHDDKMVAMYSAIPDNMDSVARGILLTVMSFNQRDSVANIVDACMTPVDVVATQFNLTDRQRISSGERITTRAVGAGAAIAFGVIVADAVETAIEGAKGDSYTNVGGRQVVQTDSISTKGNGLGLEILKVWPLQW